MVADGTKDLGSMASPQETSQQVRAVVARALQLTRDTAQLLHRAQQWSRDLKLALAQTELPAQSAAPAEAAPVRPRGSGASGGRTMKVRVALVRIRKKPPLSDREG